jgi:hypothetical protein
MQTKILMAVILSIAVAMLTGCSKFQDEPDASIWQPCDYDEDCPDNFFCNDGWCRFRRADGGGPFPQPDGGGSKDGGHGQDGGHADGGQKPSCENKTCDGCCNQYNVCIKYGSTDISCGKNSEACVDCTAKGQICLSHECHGSSDKCSYTACTGCCDMGDLCHKTSDDYFCGKGGMSCMDCTISLLKCTNGVCL